MSGSTPTRLGTLEPVRQRGAGACGTVDCCFGRAEQTHAERSPPGDAVDGRLGRELSSPPGRRRDAGRPPRRRLGPPLPVLVSARARAGSAHGPSAEGSPTARRVPPPLPRSRGSPSRSPARCSPRSARSNATTPARPIGVHTKAKSEALLTPTTRTVWRSHSSRRRSSRCPDPGRGQRVSEPESSPS